MSKIRKNLEAETKMARDRKLSDQLADWVRFAVQMIFFINGIRSVHSPIPPIPLIPSIPNGLVEKQKVVRKVIFNFKTRFTPSWIP